MNGIFTKLFFVGCLCFFLFSLPVHAQQDVIANAKQAIKTGSARELGKSFNSLVDLTIDEEKSSYSKEQAVVVLDKFFAKYPVASFEYIHQGASKQGAQYAIGKYSYEGGTFRVFMLVKKLDDHFIIDLIDFGKE
jgi:hypothetical protein